MPAGWKSETIPFPIEFAPLLLHRGVEELRQLCSGPGKVCQALGVSHLQNRLALDAPPFTLLAREEEVMVQAGPRIGISRAMDTPWRFVLAGSPYLSKPMRAPAA